MLERLEALYRALLTRPGLPPWALSLLQGIAILVREVIRDQVMVRAATLSYWSLVGVVPVLVLVAVVQGAVGGESASLRMIFYRAVLAGSVSEVGTTLDELLGQVDMARLGVAGLAGVLLIASRIFFSVEEAFNHLWKNRLKRGLISRFILFYVSVTLLPGLIAYGFHITSNVEAQVHAQLPVSISGRFTPLLLTTLAFVGTIKILPDTHVRWRPAFVGGFVSAVLFETAKVGFNMYVLLLGTQNTNSRLYGSLALVPVFLLWLYILWIIVLLGVEISYILQHWRALQAVEHRRVRAPDDALRHADAWFGVQVWWVLAAQFRQGKGPMSADQIALQLQTPVEPVREAVEVLEKLAVIAETEQGLLPTQPPDQLPINALIQRYRALTRPLTGEDAPGARAIEALMVESLQPAAAPITRWQEPGGASQTE